MTDVISIGTDAPPWCTGRSDKSGAVVLRRMATRASSTTPARSCLALARRSSGMRNVAIVGGMIPFAEHLELGITDVVPMAYSEVKR